MSVNPKAARPRLGRGLSSLISVSDLPIEAELPIQHPPATTPNQNEPTTPLTPTAQHSALSTQPSPPTPPAQNEPTNTAISNPKPATTQDSTLSTQHFAPAEIPLDAISPNPHQPRRSFDQASLASLAASIKSSGLVQPIIVRKLPNNQFQLIAGERRWRAAKLAGLSTLPAILRDVDAFTQAQLALVENIQREDLNPIDRANAYRTLMTQLGLTQAELAGRIGEDRSSVANYLRLLDLVPAVQDLIRDARLSLGHAKILAGVPDPVRQEELANLAITQDLSVRNLEKILQTPPDDPKANKDADKPSAHLRDLERNISSQLGLRVQLRSAAQKGKGKLIIHYATLDQFDHLVDRLGVKMPEE